MEHIELLAKYPPSRPCSCPVCRFFCRRPGWWSVEQARAAIRQGYAGRMMMEISPEKTFAVLAPAFCGNEMQISQNQYAYAGCCLLKNDVCTIHDSGLLPLECAYCHHDRMGKGQECHNDLEKDWYTRRGQALVIRWCEIVNCRAGLMLAVRFYERVNW